MTKRIHLGPTSSLAKHCCLRCGHDFELSTGVGVAPAPAPHEGSVSLCIRCGAVAIFTETLCLRPATPRELADLEADPEVSRIRRALAQSIALRPS